MEALGLFLDMRLDQFVLVAACVGAVTEASGASAGLCGALLSGRRALK